MAGKTGPGRYIGLGNDGEKYIVEAYLKDGIIQFRTSNREELVPCGSELDEFEIVNSMETRIRLLPPNEK